MQRELDYSNLQQFECQTAEHIFECMFSVSLYSSDAAALCDGGEILGKLTDRCVSRVTDNNGHLRLSPCSHDSRLSQSAAASEPQQTLKQHAAFMFTTV